MAKVLLCAVLLVQLAGPVLKALGLALAGRGWALATCLLWGPWAMLLVLAGVGWLLRRALRGPALAP